MQWKVCVWNIIVFHDFTKCGILEKMVITSWNCKKKSSGQNNGFVLKNLILMLHDIAVSCFTRRFKNLFFTEEIYYATNATASWCGNTLARNVSTVSNCLPSMTGQKSWAGWALPSRSPIRRTLTTPDPDLGISGQLLEFINNVKY